MAEFTQGDPIPMNSCRSMRVECGTRMQPLGSDRYAIPAERFDNPAYVEGRVAVAEPVSESVGSLRTAFDSNACPFLPRGKTQSPPALGPWL